MRVEFLILPDREPQICDVHACPREGEGVQFMANQMPLRVKRVLHLPVDVRLNARVWLEPFE